MKCDGHLSNRPPPVSGHPGPVQEPRPVSPDSFTNAPTWLWLRADGERDGGLTHLVLLSR